MPAPIPSPFNQQEVSPELMDMFNRSITYLRVSVTDQCNLRCQYCRPTANRKLARTELLTYEEILRVITLASGMGIHKVRLTGGEPLLRRGISKFIQGLSAVPGLSDIRLTTNGVLLGEFAHELLAAGIRKINVSLDTLRSDRYRQITGQDCFHTVWAGIQTAKSLGFSSIKLNTVVLKGVNDDEILDLARLTFQEPFQVRFIEFMPMKDVCNWPQHYLSSLEIQGILETMGALKPFGSSGLEGPARVFQFPGALGTIGLVSPISHQFCRLCNRLRLTAAGRLRSCLLSEEEYDLKNSLRSGATDMDIKKIILTAILQKPEGHGLKAGEIKNCHGEMFRIGG